MHPELKFSLRTFFFPILFTALLWLVKFTEIYFDITFQNYGVLPKTVEGLKGIIFSPFIHSGFDHLTSNSVPLLILITALIYFYKEVWYKVFLIVWLCGGFWLWLGGRENYHIGASGIVYGLAAFLFFSGVFRKHTGLMALSLLIVFLYGSMIWGIFPLFRDISWEGHLYGSLAGLLCAWFYRKHGLQRKVYEWESETDDEPANIDYLQAHDETGNSEVKTESNSSTDVLKIVYQKPLEIKYSYKENEPGKN